jgi:fructose-bisphosphate aldolase, class I
MADHVQEILNDYTNDNAGTKTSGKLAGTGKLVILPVDQGLNRGPRKASGPILPAHDPLYHFQLAIDAGCNAYAASLGGILSSARKWRP